MTSLTGSDIDLFRLKVLKNAVQLEANGMTRRGRSAYSIVKAEMGLRGNRQAVIKQLETMIAEWEVRR